MEEADDYIETTFIDTYGDFEHMVEMRRMADLRKGGSRLPFARASTVYDAPAEKRIELELDMSDDKIRNLKK